MYDGMWLIVEGIRRFVSSAEPSDRYLDCIYSENRADPVFFSRFSRILRPFVAEGGKGRSETANIVLAAYSQNQIECTGRVVIDLYVSLWRGRSDNSFAEDFCLHEYQHPSLAL